MSKLELILLGQFECFLPSGTRISLSMRKAEVLLAYLALTPGLRHPRERLINLLWSDRSEEQARNSLRQCLSAIRKSLGDVADMVLQVDRTTVSLIPELIDIDVHEFERLAAEGDYESLSTAADLYQGEFLEGISIRDASCQEWLDSERGRFKRQFIELLSELAETQLLSHDFRNAIKSTERLVKQDPLGESGWRLLMCAYFDNDDRSHALQAFKRCQQALREELDVEPESATIELRDQIAVGETKSAHAPTTDIGKSPLDTLAPTGDNLGESSIDPPTTTGHSIAVLPFDNLSGDPEQEYFSDGITDSVILNLSLFPRLQVKSRNSSFAYKQQIKNPGEISSELKVDYIVEGSIRRSDDRIRITVQLIEAASGNQIWGKRYDAEIENLFDLEAELSRSIAATVTGQIESELQRIAIAKSASHQQSYDLLLSGIYHLYQSNRDDIAIAIEKLNQCLELDPTNVRAHAALYDCHILNWMDRWVEDYESSFELAGTHARKAIELDPELVKAQSCYADCMFFSRQYEETASYIEKALEANPNDPDNLAIKAMNLAMQGHFQSALEIAEHAYQLDPYNHWTDWNLAEAQYLCGRYKDAADTIAHSKTAPKVIRIYAVAAYVKLGQIDAAKTALRNYLAECRESMAAMPRSVEEWLVFSKDTAPFQDSRINQGIIDCMLQAGLEEEMSTVQTCTDSGPQPSILVLPFSNLSGDPEQEYFSNGITESVILNLGSFSGINVKSRHASFAFKDSARSIDEIAAELDVQYIVEGSIRRFGDKVRITAQLADTASGNQVWGKRYDYDLEDLFALEEELSLTIAGTVSGRVDKEAKLLAMRKPARDMKSYDYFLRAIHHVEHFTTKDINIGVELFKKCLALDPDNATAHASLGSTYMVQLYENCAEDRAQTRILMLQHLERALELDPGNAITHSYLAEALHISKDFERGIVHARKAVELNPTLADGHAMLSLFASTNRQHEEAIKYADLSMQIDPFHPWIGWNAGEIYRNAEDYERAIETFRALPHLSVSVHAQIAACLVGLGRLDEAREEMREYLKLAREQMISMPANKDEWYRFWEETMPYKFKEDSDRYFDLLMQAGLCNDLDEATDRIPSIAVLPFENMSGDSDQEYFSDGITSSLILGLGLFKGLNVKSQNSSFAFKGSASSSQEIAEELNADYLIEGSIRKSGSKVRLAVQLVESKTDSQIWGKQYDAELEDILELEQELSQTIAATISGRIGNRIQQAAARKPAKDLKSYDYLLRGLYHLGRFTAVDMEIARQQLEKCLDIDPENAEAHINLAMAHSLDIYENWSSDISVSKTLIHQHNQQALKCAPENALVHAYLAEEYLNFIRDYDQAEFHADRAIELNPTAVEGYTVKADIMSFTRRYDQALVLADQCLQLDPHSVGAGWVAGSVYMFTRDFEKSIRTYRSISNPPASIHALTAASLAGHGQTEQAKIEMLLFKNLAREQMPRYPESVEAWHKYWHQREPFKFEDDFEHIFQLLVRAGLCDDIVVASDDIPSIAILPFENMSGDPEQEHFSDGITTDIIATLSRFEHMRTISRYSVLQYKNQHASIPDIAQQQNVRYILEGSVRKSGNSIRVSAELIDSQDEKICWSERYDRDLDDLFAVQDEITKNIALAMKVQLDDGDMAVHRSTGTTNIKAWQLTLAAIDLQDTYIRENILEARRMAQQAIDLDPNYPYAWVALGWTHWQEVYSGFSNSPEDSLAEAEKAQQKALDLVPLYSEAWTLGGLIHLMRHKPTQALEYCRKAVELEPGNAEIQALMAFCLIYVGDYENARQHEQTMLKLCPVLPNWYYLLGGEIAQIQGDYETAAHCFQQGIDVEPDSPLCRFYLIDVMMEQGNETRAGELADEIKALDKQVKGRGMVRTLSQDKTLRERFRTNLEKFDLY